MPGQVQGPGHESKLLKSGGDEKKLGFTKDNVQKSYIQSEAAKKASFIMATKIAKSAGLSMRESL